MVVRHAEKGAGLLARVKSVEAMERAGMAQREEERRYGFFA